jgi:glycosyltransferase involved in cell wall biosynthesis
MNSPKVSVLICVYGGERFLGETLQSALKQSYPHLEVIAVDDGSPDRSAELVSAIRDPRIRLIRQSNEGAAAALKTAIAASTGKYCAFLDQDDLWDPDNLAHHVSVLEKNRHADLTFSWFRIIDETGRDTGVRLHRARGALQFHQLFEDFAIGAWSNVVARRSAIDKAGGPDPQLPRLYDLDLCLRIARLGADNVVAIPRELMSYRRHRTQISKNVGALREEYGRLLSKIEWLAPEVRPLRPRAEANMNRYFASLAYESGDFKSVLKLMRDSICMAPVSAVSDSRNWLVLGAGLVGLVLPTEWHRRIEMLAGYRRNAEGTQPLTASRKEQPLSSHLVGPG